MSEERKVLGRRHLLVVGAATVVAPACGSGDAPLGGPYGGTTGGLPGPTGGSQGTDSGSSGSGSGSSSGATGSGSGSGSSSGTTGSSGGSDAGTGSSSGSGSSSSGGTACATGSNVYTLTFAQYPQLQTVGGSVKLMVPGYSDPNCGQGEVIVMQTSAGQYVALSTSCTHSCCSVSLSGSQLHCPCHGATFDLTGKTLTPFIAPTNLPTLQVCADATGVHITV